VIIVPPGADNNGVAVESDSFTEVIIVRGIRRVDLLSLAPVVRAAGIPLEDVSRAGVRPHGVDS